MVYFYIIAILIRSFNRNLTRPNAILCNTMQQDDFGKHTS